MYESITPLRHYLFTHSTMTYSLPCPLPLAQGVAATRPAFNQRIGGGMYGKPKNYDFPMRFLSS